MAGIRDELRTSRAAAGAAIGPAVASVGGAAIAPRAIPFAVYSQATAQGVRGVFFCCAISMDVACACAGVCVWWRIPQTTQLYCIH